VADDLLAKARKIKMLATAKQIAGSSQQTPGIETRPETQDLVGELLARMKGSGAEQPQAPVDERDFWDRLAGAGRYSLSKFNAGLGGTISAIGDLPRNVMGEDWSEPLTGGMARSLSELGHSIGDPLKESPHFQAPAADQARTEAGLDPVGKAIYGDLPHMAPALLGGPLAPEIIAGQAVSESLSPEARAAVDAQAAAEGREPPTGLQRYANAGLQGVVAVAAGKVGPLGRIGAGRQAAGEALDMLAGRAKDFGIGVAQSEASQNISSALLGTPVDHEASFRAGVSTAGLGTLVDAVKPPSIGPDTVPGKVEVVSDPVGISRNVMVEKGVLEHPAIKDLPFVEPPADPRVGHAPDTKAAETPAAPERTEPVALKEILPRADDAKEVGEWADTWIADRDEAQVNARLTASRHESELKSVVPAEPIMEALQRIAATGDRVSPAFRDMDQAMLVYIDTRGKAAEEYAKYGTELSPDQRRIFELSQNLPPEVKAIADRIASENDAQGEAAKEAGVIEEARENYVARLWKQTEPTSPPPDATAKFTTTSGRLRERTYSSVLQGMAEGRELAVPSAIDAQRIAAEQVHQVIADRKLLELGMQTGLFTREPALDRAQVEHPNFRKSTYIADVKPGEENGPTGPGSYVKDGKLFQKQPVYAPIDVAARLNRALGTSQLGKIRGVKTATAVNNVMKQSMLLYSFFHHIAMTGAHVLGNPTSAKNLNIVGAYKSGNDTLKYPTANLHELVRSGMTIGRAQDYEAVQLAERTRLEQMIDAMPVAAQSKNILKAIRDQQHDFLFHHFMPALKANAANLEFNKQLTRNRQKLLDGTITREEIARGVAVTMNNRFQSQNLLQLDRSTTTQHAFRLLALAPDWTESQARFAAQGFKPGFEGELARRTWARILFKGAVATQTANLIMSGFDDRSYWKRIKDAYNSKEGGIGGGLRALYNVDVTPLYQSLSGADEAHKYISIINQYSFPFELAEKGPAEIIQSKSSPMARAIWDAGAGVDWAGRPITTLGELLGTDNKGVYSTSKPGDHLMGQEKGGQLAGQTASYQSESQPGPIGWSQVPSWAMQEGLGVLPLEVQNTIAWISGQHDGWDATLKSLGFRATSSDPQAALKRMLEDERDHANNLLEKKQAEARLKLFNLKIQTKKMGGH